MRVLTSSKRRYRYIFTCQLVQYLKPSARLTIGYPHTHHFLFYLLFIRQWCIRHIKILKRIIHHRIIRKGCIFSIRFIHIIRLIHDPGCSLQIPKTFQSTIAWENVAALWFGIYWHKLHPRSSRPLNTHTWAYKIQ